MLKIRIAGLYRCTAIAIAIIVFIVDRGKTLIDPSVTVVFKTITILCLGFDIALTGGPLTTTTFLSAECTHADIAAATPAHRPLLAAAAFIYLPIAIVVQPVTLLCRGGRYSSKAVSPDSLHAGYCPLFTDAHIATASSSCSVHAKRTYAEPVLDLVVSGA